MRVPPWLILAALLFWGWQIGSLFTGLVLGGALELTRLGRSRWRLSPRDYQRLWDLCSVIGIAAALYCFANLRGENQIATLLSYLDYRGPATGPQVHGAVYFGQWWPILLFPFVFACVRGGQLIHPYTTFFWLLRDKPEFDGRGRIDVLVAYVVLTMLSASATLPQSNYFFFGVTGLFWWLLWTTRGRRSPLIFWLSLTMLTVHLGHWSHQRLHELQGRVEEAVADFSNNWMTQQVDPLRTHTAMGRVGELKLSGRIIGWVTVERGATPGLLREAAYSTFSSPNWYAGRGKTARKLPRIGSDSWLVGESARPGGSRIGIVGFFGDFLVPAPLGSWRLEGIDSDDVTGNAYGAVSVQGGSGFRDFQVEYTRAARADWPPMRGHSGTLEDLTLPIRDEDFIRELALELDLAGKSEPEVLLAIQNYFSSRFTYSTYQDVSAAALPKGVTPLRYFLETSRSGHCEFFATATALLLRAAGIPSRYVVGYAVSEADDEPDRYVIRERHGHAWVNYWSENGEWVDFDTTPASGFATDAESAAIYEPMTDFLRRLRLSLVRAWRSTANGPMRSMLLATALLILFGVAWRIAVQLRREPQPETAAAADSECPIAGSDSEFFAVADWLATQGCDRRADESVNDWLARLRSTADFDVDDLRQVHLLHLRYRFDPLGLAAADRRELAAKANAWLAAHRNTEPA